jgi:hypothetical protein
VNCLPLIGWNLEDILFMFLEGGLTKGTYHVNDMKCFNILS